MAKDLVSRLKGIVVDGVKIVAFSSGAILLYLALRPNFIQVVETKVVENIEAARAVMSHPPHKALLALNASSGAYAGATGNYAASIALQSASLLPDIYEVFATGNIEDAVNRALTKSVLYGGSYLVSYAIKNWD